MIIVRSPVRVSILGGTDYNSFIRKNGSGLALGFAIDKYSYIAVQKIEKFPSRIIYSKIESVNSNKDIEHKGIWAALNKENLFLQPLELTHFSQLGSSLGLGSSSAFMVALIKSLNLVNNENIGRIKLVERAVAAEQSYSSVGWQDAAFSCLGGLRSLEFTQRDKVLISSSSYWINNHSTIEEYGLLFNTRLKRNSSDQIEQYIIDIDKNENVRKIFEITKEAMDLNISYDIEKIAKLMKRGWEYKRAIHPSISNAFIDSLIETCYDNGALGAKLCGSGAGGCVFILADPKHHPNIINCMQESGCKHISFKIDTEGVKQLQ